MTKTDLRIAELLAEDRAAVERLAGREHQQTLAEMAHLLIATLAAARRVYVCGNGGSAADAQHIAGELAGRFRRQRRALPCVALTTDTSVLTAVGNDLDFESVFSRQVEALGQQGDVLWALSTSGNSPNILAAAHAARLRGMKVLAMTGHGGGKLAELADLCLRAPAERTDLIQLLHQGAYHILCELVDEHFAVG